jgi:hypothetical protein
MHADGKPVGIAEADDIVVKMVACMWQCSSGVARRLTGWLNYGSLILPFSLRATGPLLDIVNVENALWGMIIVGDMNVRDGITCSVMAVCTATGQRNSPLLWTAPVVLTVDDATVHRHRGSVLGHSPLNQLENSN